MNRFHHTKASSRSIQPPTGGKAKDAVKRAIKEKSRREQVGTEKSHKTQTLEVNFFLDKIGNDGKP
jgi:hypothetical protein